jgi:hypothetical protein
MRRLIPAVIALVLLCAVAPAPAQPPRNAISLASAAYSEGDLMKTMDLLRTALVGVYGEAPLIAQNVHFVTEEPQAYGMYSPRSGNTFDGVEPIQLYFEPVGYAFKKSGRFYSVNVDASFTVLKRDGTPLGEEQPLGSLDFRSRAANMESMIFSTINLRGLPPGEYHLKLNLIDHNSGRTGSFEKTFRIQ